jgi:hypothetical protein
MARIAAGAGSLDLTAGERVWLEPDRTERPFR